MSPWVLALRGLAGLACLAMAWLGLPAMAQPPGPAWPASSSTPPAAQDLPGWHCIQALALPAPGTQAAVCRRADARASAELHLLHLVQRDSGPPRVHTLARLGDANQVQLRLFQAEPGCTGLPKAPPCLAAVLLADQRDESSCYGTQVLVMLAGRAPQAIGFINELRAVDRSEVCIGPYAALRSVPGGAVISLPGPLLRAGRDGATRLLAEPALEYRLAAARPVLHRRALLAPAQAPR